MDVNVLATFQSILPPRPLLLLAYPTQPGSGGAAAEGSSEGIDGGVGIGDGRLGEGYNTIRWASA